MNKLITMAQALSTSEHLEDLTENEGVMIEAMFKVSISEFYGIVSMLNLTAHTTQEGDALMQALWEPNNRLSIIFTGYDE